MVQTSHCQIMHDTLCLRYLLGTRFLQNLKVYEALLCSNLYILQVCVSETTDIFTTVSLRRITAILPLVRRIAAD